MKKIFSVLSLVAVSGAMVVSSIESRNYSMIKAENERTTFIDMNASAFEDFEDSKGSFADSNATFWGEGYSFNALGNFFRGETQEGWTGTLQLKSWKQYTQFIYFQWGGAKNGDNKLRLEFHYGPYSSSMENDTFIENPMLVRYFKIPDEQYALLDKEAGFDMYIKLIDERGNDYGFHNFGYLHVNQTEEQVGDAMRFYINNMKRNSREWEVNKRKEILSHYYLNDSLKEIFLKEANSIDDGFENNGDFLNHWYFDWNYFNGGNWDLHFDRAIGTDTFRPDDNTKMPFNNTNGYFRGWYENDDLGGFVSGDNSIYRFVSRPFVLSGTGLVSIKMAGTASLHVIDPTARQDLVWADSLVFNSSGNQVNLMDGSFNTVTMVRHVINLEAYLGKKIQLAIADVGDGGWSALYADELITNYNDYPGFKIDAFDQNNNSGTFHVFKTDKYINSTIFNGETNPSGIKYVVESDMNKANDNEIINHIDNSPAKDAYAFVNGYYSSLRSSANEFDISKASISAKTIQANRYDLLSSDAKAVVNASTDLQITGEFKSDVWLNTFNVSNTISSAIAALVSEVEAYDLDPVSALKLHYAEITDAYTYSDVYIRFGGFINKDLWDELDGASHDKIQGYGVLVAANSDLDGQTLKQKYAAAKTSANTPEQAIIAMCEASNGAIGRKIVKDKENPAAATADQKVFMGVDSGDYYIWHVKKAIDQAFTAKYNSVAFILVDNDIIFLDEVSISAKEIATRDIPTIGAEDPALPAITYLKDH